jgi:hypothetical protein
MMGLLFEADVGGLFQRNFRVPEGGLPGIPVVMNREYPQVVFGFGNGVSLQKVFPADREYLEGDYLVKGGV